MFLIKVNYKVYYLIGLENIKTFLIQKFYRIYVLIKVYWDPILIDIKGNLMSAILKKYFWDIDIWITHRKSKM